ncbi:hypothetical protein OGAPHI_000091 [Ogataea philodendri]|uniref:Uncharacterized protein n=1 Tax=Ogataea philodendri TaxID=1378263 RepID=A0A9P8PI22_9ASCO|nr:uncharacterized protein OGAPHI_000091 [Ogataea philodendri]KAH3671905.1 hypothetical protein OGAPHI_000091 [Ogataea philodendri]
MTDKFGKNCDCYFETVRGDVSRPTEAARGGDLAGVERPPMQNRYPEAGDRSNLLGKLSNSIWKLILSSLVYITFQSQSKTPLVTVFQVSRQPFETLVQTVTRSGACGLDEPWSWSDGLQTQFLGDLSSIHGVCFKNTVSVVGVDNEDDSLGVLEVVSPQWSNFVLSTNVPDGEGDVLVLHGFNVETDSWNCGDNLTQLQLI